MRWYIKEYNFTWCGAFLWVCLILKQKAHSPSQSHQPTYLSHVSWRTRPIELYNSTPKLLIILQPLAFFPNTSPTQIALSARISCPRSQETVYPISGNKATDPFHRPFLSNYTNSDGRKTPGDSPACPCPWNLINWWASRCSKAGSWGILD